MSEHKIRVYLKDVCVRVAAVGTLIVVAAFFATRPNIEIPQSNASYHQSKNVAQTQVDDDKLLGIKSDGWTAIFTGVLAVFTSVLSTVSIVQIHFLNRSDKTAAITAQAAKTSADAAIKSVNIAERAIEGTEAPFLFLIIQHVGKDSNIIVTSPQGVVYPDGFEFTFKNYGRSPAIIRDVYMYCVATEGIPGPCPFPPLHSPLLQTEIVAAGGTAENRPLPQIASAVQNDGKMHKWAGVFVVGQVRYADVFGNQYISGFSYAFNAHLGRFYAMGGETHNYRRKLNDDERAIAKNRDSISGIID